MNLSKEQKDLMMVLKANNRALLDVLKSELMDEFEMTIRRVIRQELTKDNVTSRPQSPVVSESMKKTKPKSSALESLKKINEGKITGIQSDDDYFSDTEITNDDFVFSAPDGMFEVEDGRYITEQQLKKNPKVFEAQNAMFKNLDLLID